jgi:hypothetical protein
MSPLRDQQVTATYRFVTMIINITITILDSIHRIVFYLKHNVLETGFCLRLKAERTQFDRTCPETYTISIRWVKLSSST